MAEATPAASPPEEPNLVVPTALTLPGVAAELDRCGFVVEAYGRLKALAFAHGQLASMTPAEVTAESRRKLDASEVSGLGIRLGPDAVRTRGDACVMPLALELEGRATAAEDWMVRWRQACSEVSGDDVRKVLGGWVEETPSGGRRWLFEVSVAGADADEASRYGRWLLDQLPSRKAMRVGEVCAEMLTARAILAPSNGKVHETGRPYRRVSGGPGAVPLVSPGALFELSEILTAVTDEPALPTGRSSGRLEDRLSPRAKEAARRFNRSASTKESLDILLQAGWTRLGTSNEGEIELSRPRHPSHRLSAWLGGRGRGAGYLFMLSTSDSTLAEGAHSPFAVRARLCHGGDGEACARALIASGRVKARPVIFFARERPSVDLGQDSKKIVTDLVTALVEAEHPTDTSLPFVLHRVSPFSGASMGLISPITRSVLRPWSPKEAVGLVIAVAQPIKWVPKRGLVPVSSLEAALASETLANVERNLPEVSVVADHPLLLGDGTTLTTPGWHPAHRALLTFDAADWSGYAPPAHPSQADAQAAMDWVVTEVLGDFPFQGNGDLARAVVWLLVCSARSLMPTAPGFIFVAPDPGSGKDLLARVGRIVGSGAESYISVAHTDTRSRGDETRKALVSAVLAGMAFAHVSEVPRGEGLDSLVLAELLTNADFHERKLGVNVSVPLAGLVISACGNNVHLDGDHPRRWLPVQLWYSQGNPEGRSGFRHPDLVGWAKVNRQVVLAKLHTILSWRLRHPLPASRVQAMGSFEGFAATALAALADLQVCGEDGMAAVMSGLKEWRSAGDPLGDNWGPLLAGQGRG